MHVPSKTQNITQQKIRWRSQPDNNIMNENDDDDLPIAIGGSHMEGGGQILRNAVAYAVILDKSVDIRNVRANRPSSSGGSHRGGGVRAQHLAGMVLAVGIGNLRGVGGRGGAASGALVGAEVGSGRVSYVRGARRAAAPSAHRGNDGGAAPLVADTRTAGSVALLLQVALLPGLVRAAASSSAGRRGGGGRGGRRPCWTFAS